MSKAATAFRTISEVAQELDVPKHVLRFWELKFPQLKPMKRGGGRRYYRPEDLDMLRGIRHLLYADGYTIKGVQKILRERGIQAVKAAPSLERNNGHVSPGPTGRQTPDAPRSARAKGAGPLAKRRAKGAKPSQTGKRATAAGAAPPALSAKSIKAVERVIKELRACRDVLHLERRPRPSRAPAKPKTRRARAQR